MYKASILMSISAILAELSCKLGYKVAKGKLDLLVDVKTPINDVLCIIWMAARPCRNVGVRHALLCSCFAFRHEPNFSGYRCETDGIGSGFALGVAAAAGGDLTGCNDFWSEAPNKPHLGFQRRAPRQAYPQARRADFSCIMSEALRLVSRAN